MKKRDEIANRDSCLNRAADDEPLFVLRAHDPRMSTVVRMWADEYADDKGGVAKMDARELAKYNDALAAAREAENWHREHRLREIDATGVRS